jgi:hypothetical protein
MPKRSWTIWFTPKALRRPGRSPCTRARDANEPARRWANFSGPAMASPTGEPAQPPNAAPSATIPRIRILVVPRPRSPERNRKAKAIEDTRKPSVRPWQSLQVWTTLCWPVPLHLQLDYLADGRFRFSLIPRRPAIRSIVSTEVRKLAAASSNVAEAAAI